MMPPAAHPMYVSSIDVLTGCMVVCLYQPLTLVSDLDHKRWRIHYMKNLLLTLVGLYILSFELFIFVIHIFFYFFLYTCSLMIIFVGCNFFGTNSSRLLWTFVFVLWLYIDMYRLKWMFYVGLVLPNLVGICMALRA